MRTKPRTIQILERILQTQAPDLLRPIQAASKTEFIEEKPSFPRIAQQFWRMVGVAALMICMLPAKAATQELITDGGFEQLKTYWSATGGAGTRVEKLTYPRTGLGYASLGIVNDALGSVHQIIAVRADAISAKLVFWINITSTEPGATSNYDQLDVNLRSIQDTLIVKLKTFSEANRGVTGTYLQAELDVTPWLPQVRWRLAIFQFWVDTDSNAATVFRIDDVSLVATRPDPVTLTRISMDGPATIEEGGTAQYQITAFRSDLTSEAGVSGSWSVSGNIASIDAGNLKAGSVVNDTTVTITARYTENGLTQTVSRDVTIQNKIDPPIIHTITAEARPHGSIFPSGAITVEDGLPLTLGASPDSEFEVEFWEIDGNIVQRGGGTFRLEAVRRGQTVTVTFTEISHVWTLVVNPNGGTVTREPDAAQYPDGTVVTLTALAPANQRFAGWTGALTSTGNPAQVTMNGNMTVTANFTNITPPQQFRVELERPLVRGGIVSVPVKGPGGTDVVVEYSHDLKVWSQAGRIVIAASGTAVLAMPIGTTDDARFFRVVAPMTDPVPITLQPGPDTSRDIWTTSLYSYGPPDSYPGGGKNDERLRVGGWGGPILLPFAVRPDGTAHPGKFRNALPILLQPIRRRHDNVS